jgi:hypothetical protein
VFRTHTAPNQALEPTAYSFGFAYAFGGGSLPALGRLHKDKTISEIGAII